MDVAAFNVAYLITAYEGGSRNGLSQLVSQFLKSPRYLSITMAANPTEKMSPHPHLQAFLVHGEITNSFSLSYSSLSGHHNGQGTKADTACEGKEPTS